MRRMHILAGAAVAALAIVIVTLLAVYQQAERSQNWVLADYGAPFSLKTHTGARLSNSDLRGRPFAVFFGFTYCPDVCPTTMLELSETISQLGAEADQMTFLFVSVDPERDTQEHLATYLSNFDKRIIGLVGTPDEIAALARGYRAYYEKVPTKDGYTVNHTATTYLMDREGRLFGTLAYQERPENRLAKLKRLIASR